MGEEAGKGHVEWLSQAATQWGGVRWLITLQMSCTCTANLRGSPALPHPPELVLQELGGAVLAQRALHKLQEQRPPDLWGDGERSELAAGQRRTTRSAQPALLDSV